jgi:imidazole glycerol-phosphate synthase subunit HisH
VIAIIDYGVGNLASVEKAFHFLGLEAKISSDKNFILQADAVVLPGVGAFADAMGSLEKAGMVEVVKGSIAEDKPFLGICLGMQLLFDYSEEGEGPVKGLGVLKGSIKQLPLDMNLKVPHMGWNSLHIQNNSTLFDNLPENPYVYFVHSYYLTAEDRNIVIAKTGYGIEFDAAVCKGKVFATQFHPEKSGKVGLAILKNFASVIKS